MLYNAKATRRLKRGYWADNSRRRTSWRLLMMVKDRKNSGGDKHWVVDSPSPVNASKRPPFILLVLPWRMHPTPSSARILLSCLRMQSICNRGDKSEPPSTRPIYLVQWWCFRSERTHETRLESIFWMRSTPISCEDVDCLVTKNIKGLTIESISSSTCM